MNHPYQNVIDQCEKAVRSVSHLLKKDHADDALAYILEHNEWLLGIECAIDWLCEDELRISTSQFENFEKAYGMMSVESDSRIEHLKQLVQNGKML